MKTFFLICAFHSSALVFAQESENVIDKGIYGEDNRTFASASTVLNHQSQAVLAQIPNWRISSGKDSISIEVKDLRSGLNFCEDERFVDLPLVSSCTAFLVGPDLIMTAGHCIKDKYECKKNTWVIDYDSAGDFVAPSSSMTFSYAKTFSCRELIGRSENIKIDYALIRLDREVVGVHPLKIRREGKVDNSEPLAVVGHPLGLPKIIADNVLIRDNTSSPFVFKTNADTFSGNSGSPVIGLKSGLVEGILVRGDDDFKMDLDLGCQRPVVCTGNECRGETVQRLPVIPLKNIPKI